MRELEKGVGVTPKDDYKDTKERKKHRKCATIGFSA